jgi:hypothetical protein
MSEESKVVLPFKTQTGLDVVTVNPKNYEGLVTDLFMDVGVSMLAAKPKAGKSSLARQLAVCVAEGRSFLGKTVKQGNVLYLNLEGPEEVVKAHFKNLGLTQSKGKVELVHEHMPRQGELGLHRLALTLDVLTGVRLVVVDTIGKLLRLANSDSYDEVTVAVESLEKIAKKYSTHVLFLTHAKKRQTDDSGDSPIGSTAFRGGTDCNVFIKKQGQRRIISTEQRWGTPIEEETFLEYDRERQEMSLGKRVDEEVEERQESRSMKTLLRIERDLLTTLTTFGLTPERRDKGPTQSELLNPVQGKTALKLQVLSELVESGRVSAHEDGKAMRYKFVVPQESEEAA